MIKKTIESIQAHIKSAKNLQKEQRDELLQLVNELETEVSELSQERLDQLHSAVSMTGVVNPSAIEVTQNIEVAKLLSDDLKEALASFEAAHPKLVDVTNRLCMLLSSLGI